LDPSPFTYASIMLKIPSAQEETHRRQNTNPARDPIASSTGLTSTSREDHGEEKRLNQLPSPKAPRWRSWSRARHKRKVGTAEWPTQRERSNCLSTQPVLSTSREDQRRKR
jgi:hypothetical protein